MPRLPIARILLGLLATVAPATAAEQTWTVDGTRRTALVVLPDAQQTQPKAGWPVVFVFHGHGGSSAFSQRMYHIEQAWFGCVVVYPQGLPRSGLLTDPDGQRPGWDMQTAAATNPDVAFFDAMLAGLVTERHVDAKQVFVAGHSNGGGFAYVLWGARADAIAGVAPSSASTPRAAGKLSPKPALISAGRRDPLVPFAWQERNIEMIENVDGCTDAGTPWGPQQQGVLHASTRHAPLVTLVYDGGHAPPADIGQLVAAFFQALAKQ